MYFIIKVNYLNILLINMYFSEFSKLNVLL